MTLAILAGGVYSCLLLFLAKTGLETTCSSLLSGVRYKILEKLCLQYWDGLSISSALCHLPSVPKLEKQYQACESWMVRMCSAQSLFC